MNSSGVSRLKNGHDNNSGNGSKGVAETKRLKAVLPTAYNLVCFSHLRWDFVFQRPQHLLTRCAKERRVFYIEEPIIIGADEPARMEVGKRDTGVTVAVPHLPEGLSDEGVIALQRKLIDELFTAQEIHDYVLWYYTPMALPFSRHLEPMGTVYDCMDELSAFKGAPGSLGFLEQELLQRADVVFTGGHSLYEAKRKQHPNIHPFPSSIDRAHFAQARQSLTEPADQANIPHPRLGFFGVIDERMDLELLAGVADARPEWQLVIVGPVVKIDEADLPRRDNIHYLGMKSYQELPAYLSGWDAALLPFARNESTRFISPTKTPEYLAAGKPVVSTAIRDVVRPYGQNNLVHIADTVERFVTAIEAALHDTDGEDWLERVDAFLSLNSWNSTWMKMMQLIGEVVRDHKASLSATSTRAAQGDSPANA
jgi:UDP-galactopyranose mutase